MAHQAGSSYTLLGTCLLLLAACSGEGPRPEAGETPAGAGGDLQQLLSRPVADPEALVQVEIRPTRLATRSAVRDTDTGWQAFNLPLLDALAYAFETRRSRIVVEGDLPEGGFDFTFAAPGGSAVVRPLARRALQAAFDLEVGMEERAIDVYVLERDPAVASAVDLPGAGAHEGGLRSSEGSLEGRGITSTRLVQALEQPLDRPVLDETGLEETFDVALAWEPGDVGSLQRALRERLGLRARPATREIEVLVVRRRSAPGDG